MKSRTGKIARLPRPIRQELNSRLECAEPGQKLLDWLNALPEVQQLLQEEFGGGAITKQNLSHWRQNGFQDWLAREDLQRAMENAAEFAEDMEAGEEIELVDNVATMLAARSAALVSRWDGSPNPVLEARANAFNKLCQTIVRLQKSMHWASKENHEATLREEAHDAEQMAQTRKRLLQPIFDSMTVTPLTKIFGGGDLGEKLARYVLAIRSNQFESPDAKPDFSPHPQSAPSVPSATSAPSDAVQSSPTTNPPAAHFPAPQHF